MRKILVAGGGGFIGGFLVADLRRQGFEVRAVDYKPINQWHQVFQGVENSVLDLREKGECEKAVQDCDEVYNLAADMGGMGFIENHKAECMLSVLINTHLLMAAQKAKVSRFFYSSSACVYAAQKQLRPDLTALVEEDAYPAMPEDGYGWEKLFSERMCRHFTEDYGLITRVARYHNVYGPLGTFEGGREKAPAAICRKIAEAKFSGKHEIEIWGDGEQSRSFQYIEDCVLGTQKIMGSDAVTMPINLGSRELVTINQLVDYVEEIAGIQVKRSYKRDAPKGVRGRNSDNTLIQKLLGWEPTTPLKQGLEKTYAWIYNQIKGRSA